MKKTLFILLTILNSMLFMYYITFENKIFIEHPTGKAIDRASPYDRIKESQIKVYNDRVVIELQGAEWSRFTDTNSMDPVIDKGANAIEVVPKSNKDIHIGDIIAFKPLGYNFTIIHRVVYIGNDRKGWYAITRGDNLKHKDPFKIRFNEIKRVVVAIIY